MSFILRSLALLAGLAPLAASESARVHILDTAVPDEYVNVEVKFAIDEHAGRAWVEAFADNGGAGEVYDHQTFRVKPDGLSYDPGAGEIAYMAEGRRAVCARVAKSRFLFVRWQSIKRTTACRLLARFESVLHDDGFERYKRKHLRVELSVVE